MALVMAVNDSNYDSDGNLEKATGLISDEETKRALKIILCIVSPSISVLGLVGNALSITILFRHGLHKTSNILLFSLAIADSCFLIGVNSFPTILYIIYGDQSFLYSKPVSTFLYVLYLFFLVLDYGVGMTGLTIPMLITVERFIAVFFPLKFTVFVTPQRIWISLAGVSLYWLIYIGYTCFWFEFSYEYDTQRNMSVGIIGRSSLFYEDLPKIGVLNEVFFSMKIPPLFTLLGCVLIIIKLRVVSKKRQKMTNTPSEQSNMKTNKMLLAVCFVYIFACMAVALPTYLPKEWMSYSLTSDEPSNLGTILYHVMNTVICVNSSWNFIIYVGMNKNFRDTFKEIIGNCFHRSKK